ncbi:hypothetical protein DH86_00000038 [Scytalidium sp. 3C]|nr:hypothetical protein DH86_00000038 [Scytalidium sp. 3C]
MGIDTIVTDPLLRQALEVSQQAREQAIKLLDDISDVSTASPVSDEIQLEISKQRKLLLSYLAQLRGLHRGAHLSARETKALTAEARQELPLIPVEEFLKLHPEHAEADDVALTIARIEHEHAERQALEEQRQGLLKKKQGLIADNKKRKDDLANLDKDLEKFIDAAKPIQKTFEKNV